MRLSRFPHPSDARAPLTSQRSAYTETNARPGWLIRIEPDICHRGLSYTVHGVYSTVYSIVHCKEPLKSFEIRVGHTCSPGLGFPSVAILSHCAESDVRRHSLTHAKTNNPGKCVGIYICT